MFSNFLEDDYFNSITESKQSMVAKTDILEGEKEFTLRVDLPGFKKEAIEIDVDSDNLVQISG